MAPLDAVRKLPFLSITGTEGLRGGSKVGAARRVSGEGYEGGSGNIGAVNLEDKTGTSNQAATLPGGRETVMARRLDLSA